MGFSRPQFFNCKEGGVGSMKFMPFLIPTSHQLVTLQNICCPHSERTTEEQEMTANTEAASRREVTVA